MDKKANGKTIKRAITDWLKVLVLLLDEAAAIVLVIVVLRFFKVEFPLPLTITIAIILGIIIFIVHKAVIPSFHWKPVTGTEGIIGAEGKVVKTLNPVGTITVRGERWKAMAIDGEIKSGEDVEIAAVEGLTLKVRQKRKSEVSSEIHS
ncbi:NfeD family protein [Chloroflexota bacterium]